jgi:hypothetical protein
MRASILDYWCCYFLRWCLKLSVGCCGIYKPLCFCSGSKWTLNTLSGKCFTCAPHQKSCKNYFTWTFLVIVLAICYYVIFYRCIIAKMSVASVRVCSIETVILLFFYLPQNPHVEGENFTYNAGSDFGSSVYNCFVYFLVGKFLIELLHFACWLYIIQWMQLSAH